jgi:peptide/nickel transport system permease protein
MQRWPVLPALVMTALIVAGIFAPLISPQSAVDPDLRHRNDPPIWMDGGTAERILGGDALGRDVLSRAIYGARVSLLVVAVSLASGYAVGVSLGLISGYAGGLFDEVTMRLVDVWFSIPFLLLALIVAIVFKPSVIVVVCLLALVTWSAFVRNVRAEVLVIKEMDYVMAARIGGASPARIMYRHVFPMIVNTTVVIATLRVGGLILSEASLSFLGAGIPASTPSWGVMIAEGRAYLDTAWWISTIPGIALFGVVMSMNFLGDWMRDRFDPRLRQL